MGRLGLALRTDTLDGPTGRYRGPGGWGYMVGAGFGLDDHVPDPDLLDGVFTGVLLV